MGTTKAGRGPPKAIAAHAGIGEGRPRKEQHVLKEQQKVGAFGRQIVEARRVHLLSEIFMEYGLHSLKPDHRPSLDSPRRYRGDANDLGVAAMDALGSLAYACAGSNNFIAQLDVDIPEQLAGLLLHEMDVGNKKTPRRFGRGMVGRENETRMGAAENRPTDGRAFRCSQGEARRRWRVVDALVQVLYWRNKARGVEDQDECFRGAGQIRRTPSGTLRDARARNRTPRGATRATREADAKKTRWTTPATTTSFAK